MGKSLSSFLLLFGLVASGACAGLNAAGDNLDLETGVLGDANVSVGSSDESPMDGNTDQAPADGNSVVADANATPENSNAASEDANAVAANTNTSTSTVTAGTHAASGTSGVSIAASTGTGPSPSTLTVATKQVLMTSSVGSATSYPRLARLANGNYLGCFSRFSNGSTTLVTTLSTNAGSTFTDLGVIAQSTGDLGNCAVLELPATNGQGTPPILAAFRNHDLDANKNYTYYRITVTRSNDGGKTWSYVAQAAQKAPPWGLWEPFMRLGTDGSVKLTYSEENAANDQDTMQVISTNQGATWSAATTASGTNVTARDGMNGVAATTDAGKPALVMVFETTQYGKFSLESVMSYDDGKTWTNRAVVYRTASSAHNAGSPQIAAFADGSLAVVFMTDEDSATVNWVSYASVKVIHSPAPVKGVLKWSSPLLVSPANSYWPGITAVAPYKAWMSYDHGGSYGRMLTWTPAN